MPAEKQLVSFTRSFCDSVPWKLCDNGRQGFTVFVGLQVKLISTNKELIGCITRLVEKEKIDMQWK